MSKKTLLFVLSFISFISLQAQVTYVDQDAGGANDGSSWADAYLSLRDALSNTTSGDIWVAGGTYSNGGMTADTASRFFVQSPVSLYGGFAGTEAAIEDRDLAANETRLSADFNGDDVKADFSVNRGDNAHHVMVIDSLIAGSVTIDGFIFSGGNTNLTNTASELSRRGGGIFAYSRIHVNQCKFEDNAAHGGAGIFISASSSVRVDSSTIKNSLFDSNLATSQSAGILLEFQIATDIEDCTFSNNLATRGCIYPRACAGVNVINCLFDKNRTLDSTGFGAAFFSAFSAGVLLENCTFSENTAGNATSVYHDGRLLNPLANNVTINNCTFNGNVATDFGGPCLYFWQAGGVNIQGSTFTNNRGSNAGVMYHDGREVLYEESQVNFNDCTFTGNQSPGFGGAFYTWQSSLSVTGGSFENNLASNSGVLYVDGRQKEITNSATRFSGVEFRGNSVDDFAGGCIYSWQAGLRIDDCIFDGNTAPNGGAIFANTGQQSYAKENMLISNTIFTGNSASGFGGGAIYLAPGSMTIDTCSFVGNSGTNGASIYSQNNKKEIAVLNSTFSGGSATFGSAIICYNDTSDLIVENCDFIMNDAATSGAVLIGFDASGSIHNSVFDGNTAGNGAGIYVQNDGTTLNIDSCQFLNNVVGGNGGAIAQAGGAELSINASSFESNFAGFGGGLSSSSFGNNSTSAKLTVDNTTFSGNVASTQGGAINLASSDATITSTLISNNFSVGGVSGGGISINANDTSSVVVDIVNCTLVGNDGEIGDGFSTFTGNDSSELVVRLRNTILNNGSNGANYALEGGTPEVISLGGNVSNDASLDAVMTSTNDQNSIADLLFVDEANFDFHLSKNSPAVDNGVAGAPEFDIEGNARVGMPDAGAYEYSLGVGIEEILVDNNDQLKVMPNPIADILNIELDNDWNGQLNARVYNMHGQVIKAWTFNKTSQLSREQFDVSSIPTGGYSLVVDNVKQAVVSRLIKI